MTVSDDGVGIADMEATRHSHGLAGMAHRVRTMGGTFDVRALKPGGTRLEMTIPL